MCSQCGHGASFTFSNCPNPWLRYLGFGRPVPQVLFPRGAGSRRGYLVARVLPMGFVNSVAIAQHMHRNVVRRSMAGLTNPVGGHQELRRDRPATSASSTFRVYLDNYDHLERVSRPFALMFQGQASLEVKELHKAYEAVNLPIHPKKMVNRELIAEVQGALVDGEKGQVLAKAAKVARYVGLALQVLRVGRATQRELQVVGGGLVYVAMFKRPLLCSLNALRAIVDLDDKPKGSRVASKVSSFGVG